MSADNSLADRVRSRLADLQASNLIRTLRPPAGIDFSSNDYLGLAREGRVVDAFVAAARRDGCGSTGSRLLRGERLTFSTVEHRFAAFKGAERSLFFGSGYLANLATLTTFPEAGDVIFSDERNHASIIDGIRLSRARAVVFPHHDVQRLAALLGGTPTEGTRFVVVESLFSMDGDEAPLAEYAALCREHQAVLIVDEAHAVGVYGERGSGLLEARGLAHDHLISINTAGKALGVGGAFVAGPAWAVEYLVQRARPFIFATAPPPAMAEALIVSLDIVEHDAARRGRLLALAGRLRDRLTRAGVRVPAGRSQIVPVLIGDNAAALGVAEAMAVEGFDVRAIRPPSVPPGTARLRVSVNAAVDTETIDRFADRLSAVLKEAGLCSVASS